MGGITAFPKNGRLDETLGHCDEVIKRQRAVGKADDEKAVCLPVCPRPDRPQEPRLLTPPLSGDEFTH